MANRIIYLFLILGVFLSISISAQGQERLVYSISEVLGDNDGDGTIDLLNQEVWVTGRASVDNWTFNDELLSVYIQDSKAGVQLFSGSLKTDIKAGDSLFARGKLQLYYDKAEIVADSIEVISDVKKIPDPVSLSRVIANPEKYIGMLAEGEAIVSQKSVSSGYRGVTVSVSDSTNRILEVYIPQSHVYRDNFNLEYLTIGDAVKVKGIVGKFTFESNGEVVYQLMPRVPENVKTSGLPGRYVNFLAWGGGLAIILVVGWIVMLRRQVRAQTIELSDALKEKELLMQEIHHRVKNNLTKISSLLDLQIHNANHPAVEESLSNSKSRINSMALIHDKLYQTQKYRVVRLDQYLKELISTIHMTYTEEQKKVELEFDLDPVELSVDKAVVSGLLVNELIVNAYKYAFDNNESGVLKVILKKDDGHILLSIADNGPGLPGEFQSIIGNGLGSVLIQSFAEQLDAEMEVNTSSKGTEFRFSFQ